MYNTVVNRENKLCNVHNRQKKNLTFVHCDKSASRPSLSDSAGKTIICLYNFGRRNSNEKHETHGCRTAGSGHGCGPCGLRRRQPERRGCGRQCQPDLPDLGRGPAGRYAGHVRCLHRPAPQREDRGAGDQLERILDQAGGRCHQRPDAGHLLDAHQRAAEIRRQRHAGGLLRHRGHQQILGGVPLQRQRLGRHAVRRSQGQGHRGPCLQ